MPVRLIAAAVLLFALVAAPVLAQGRGNAFGKGRKSPPSVVTTPSGESVPTNAGAREFGSWLDDATLVDPQSGWVAVSLGRYYSTSGHQTDFPVVDGAIGWTRRVQLGITVPYSRFSTNDGGSLSGRGDVYLNAKISLRDRLNRPRGTALAMTPLIEVLSDPDPIHGGRLFWALPVSGEIRLPDFRLYGSGGYFSRGVVFGSGAIEVPATERLVATGALTWTRSLADDPAADALGLSASRVDITCGSAYALNSSFAIFGSIGRTLSKIDANSSTMMLNGGLALTFARRVSTPPSRRP